MGVRVQEEFYRVNGKEVTKEEWLYYRQILEKYRRREEQKDGGNINNEENIERWRHLDEGENNNDPHGETIATLEFIDDQGGPHQEHFTLIISRFSW